MKSVAISPGRSPRRCRQDGRGDARRVMVVRRRSAYALRANCPAGVLVSGLETPGRRCRRTASPRPSADSTGLRGRRRRQMRRAVVADAGTGRTLDGQLAAAGPALGASCVLVTHGTVSVARGASQSWTRRPALMSSYSRGRRNEADPPGQFIHTLGKLVGDWMARMPELPPWLWRRDQPRFVVEAHELETLLEALRALRSSSGEIAPAGCAAGFAACLRHARSVRWKALRPYNERYVRGAVSKRAADAGITGNGTGQWEIGTFGGGIRALVHS